MIIRAPLTRVVQEGEEPQPIWVNPDLALYIEPSGQGSAICFGGGITVYVEEPPDELMARSK